MGNKEMRGAKQKEEEDEKSKKVVDSNLWVSSE